MSCSNLQNEGARKGKEEEERERNKKRHKEERRERNVCKHKVIYDSGNIYTSKTRLIKESMRGKKNRKDRQKVTERGRETKS